MQVMDRVSLSSSSEIPVNSPVLKMREFEFQVAAMHRENDELRLIIEQKNKEIQALLAEKGQFVVEQEEAEQRYMELEDKFIDLERQLKRGGGPSTPLAQSTALASSSNTTTINVAASSSPYVNNNGNNHTLGTSQSIGRSTPSSLSSSSQSISPPLNHSTALSSSQAVSSPSPLANSSALSSSSSVVPSMSTGVTRGGKAVAPVSPTLTSCVVDHHASHLEVSVVPSPTPAKKSRKKSIISLFSL